MAEYIAEVYSLKLISCEHILTEIVTSDNDKLVLKNPLLLNSDDSETVYATDYDKSARFTDHTLLVLPTSSLLLYPTPVDDFYKRFYVEGVLFMAIKRGKLDVASADESEKLPLVKVWEEKITNIASSLSKTFGIPVKVNMVQHPSDELDDVIEEMQEAEVEQQEEITPKVTLH